MYSPTNKDSNISDQEFRWNLLHYLDQLVGRAELIAAAISRSHVDAIATPTDDMDVDHTTDDGQMTTTDALNLAVRGLSAEKNITLQQAADAMGEDYTKLRRRMARGTITITDMAGLALAFGISPAELFNRAKSIQAHDTRDGEDHE